MLQALTYGIFNTLYSCASHIGMSGYKQKLSLGTLCWDHGVAAHEIGETRYDHEVARILRGGVRTSLEVV